MALDSSQFYKDPATGTTYTSKASYDQNVKGVALPGNVDASTGQATVAPTPIPVPQVPVPAMVPGAPAVQQPVASAQPNPATVQAQPYTSSAFYKPDQAVAGYDPSTVFNDKNEALSKEQYLAQGGKADFSNVQKVSSLKQAFNAATASGQPAPQTAGDAASAIKQFAPESNPQVQQVQSQLEQSPEYAQFLTDVKEYNNVANQSKSLVDTYKQFITDAGIPGINTELLNTKKIIDGTEDDIRNEIKATSGFATESQVLALSGARNKTLIQNYNNLLATKQMAQEQVNTMIGLASSDRDYAMQAITQKLNIDQQALEIKDKMISAAKEGYANVINAIGYQGLYESLKNDPHSVQLAEQTLGLKPGQLQGIGNLQNHSQYSISSPYVLTDSGEVQDTKTGYGFKTPEDFKNRTGMTLEQAKANNLLKPLGLTKADQKVQAEAQQQNFDNQIKVAGLDLQQQSVNVSKQNAGISAANLSLAREKFQYDQVKDMIAASTLQPEVLGKIQSSNEYKTISGLLPAIQSITKYREVLAQQGTYANPLTKSGRDARGALESAQSNALVAWKSLAQLGALSGADFELADKAIPTTGFFKSNTGALSKLNGSLDNAVTQAQALTKRLIQAYPQATDLLTHQMDDLLVSAYPNKYKVGPDGQVYEITQ